LARLLTEQADLWLLDEPAAALDAEALDTLTALIHEFSARGGCVVLSSHQPLALDDVARPTLDLDEREAA